MIPLTKTLNPADMDEPAFLDQLVMVDRHWDTNQHPMRRWEYGMALLALQTGKEEWLNSAGKMRIADVGGAGSPFHLMTGYETVIIDPAEPESDFARPVEAIARRHAEVYDAVFSISVFEHTMDPLAFLEGCWRILKPHGLLFLTFDYCGRPDATTDTFHFNWMRERVVTRAMWDAMIGALTLIKDMELFGDVNCGDNGPQVYDYTFASLCLKKGSP